MRGGAGHPCSSRAVPITHATPRHGRPRVPHAPALCRAARTARREDLKGERYDQGMKESARLIIQLLNGSMPDYKYGMGSVRTRDQYWAWARMDWKTKTSEANKKFC